MDFLEQLKKEVDEARSRKDLEEAALKRNLSQFRSDAQMVMLQVYRYLKHFLDTLNTSDMVIRHTYELEGYGELPPYTQTNYMLLTTDPASIDELTFQFEAVGDKLITFRKSGRNRISRQRDMMWSHGLRFEFKERLGAIAGAEKSVNFTVEPWIPVKIVFAINEAGRNIRLRLKNLVDLEDNIHSLKLDDIDRELLDELAKRIVRKPDRLNSKLGFSVTDTLRMRLQARLKFERRAPQADPDALVKPSGGLLGRLRSALRRG